MKITLTSFFLLLSMNAFATGSFHCTGKFRTSTVHVSAPTSHIEGNPMIGPLHVTIDGHTDTEFDIPKDRVVGYWSSDGLFLMNVLDSDFNLSEIKMSYNSKIEKGVMRVNFNGVTATTKRVSCIFE